MNNLPNLKSFRLLPLIAIALLQAHFTALAAPNNNTSLGLGFFQAT